MKQPRAAGFLILKGSPVEQFLLMKHPKRWDLPKGHVDPGETDLQAAYRELEEETGIPSDAVQLHPEFEYVTRYSVNGKRYGGGDQPVEKTTRIFLATLFKDLPIRVTEHEDYRWFSWQPPHSIQATAIDPLLAEVETFLRQRNNP